MSSSGGSLALGTMSERNSRSSEESAKELFWVPFPRANRFRKRETAEGGGAVAATAESVGGGGATEGVDAFDGETAREAGGWEPDLTLSRLDLGGELDRSLGASTGTGWIADALRFQNDSKPPVAFFCFDSSGVARRSCFSRTRQPTCAVSGTVSCLALMEFSHSKEPFEASKRDRGLLADAGK
jgi:hypothetical protein